MYNHKIGSKYCERFSGQAHGVCWGLLACCVSLYVAGCKAKQPVGLGPSREIISSAEIPDEDIGGRQGKAHFVSTSKRFPSLPGLKDSIVIGLDADMSSGAAKSGEAIRRGLELAIEQINCSGGLLGKQVELIIRDHRGNPDRGLGNLEAFCQVPNLLGVFGGIHTPVAMRELEFIHENKILYFGPWAAGTPIVNNGYSPNYVFRVSVRDEYAGGFLVGQALNRGNTRIGLMLERTAWGRSNEKAIGDALSERGLEAIGTEWFNWGERDLHPQLERLVESDCEVVLFVGNPFEGVTATEAVASIPEEQRPSVISHWGITGGNFFEMAQENLDKIDLVFLQTFSFLEPRYPARVEAIANEYLNKYYDCEDARDIFAPVGTAHAYELMQMIAAAVSQAGTTESIKVHAALEGLRDYQGIIRDYAEPFRPDHHDALDASDFILARFGTDGAIIPVKK
ncbi:MAG: ABC transporter substrate-binding protein [Planctomycetota bacterium]